MTRFELLQLLVGQARHNGFEFRKWFVADTGISWPGGKEALAWLSEGRRAATLLFSHNFASHFWKSGEPITFMVDSQSFTRVKPDGSIATVHRKGYTRRSGRTDVWRYHLQQMAATEEPLRYIRRFLLVEEDLDEAPKHNPSAIHH